MISVYYRLTKPGIIYGNLLTSTGGFFLASKGNIDLWLLFMTLAGISLVIASACVFNNYLDQNIDKKMARTKKRALASGIVSTKHAIIYAASLGLIGFIILAKYTNPLTFYLGLIAIFFYVVVYGFAKRHTRHGTLVGTVPGALPPVAGYTAVTGSLDPGAGLLFLVMVAWQMAHFFSIAIYRLKDYESAGIPVLPSVKGIEYTKKQILFYIALFIIGVGLLTIYDYTGAVFAAVMITLGMVWFTKGISGFRAKNHEVWARSMFLFSLIVITSFSIMLSLESVLT